MSDKKFEEAKEQDCPNCKIIQPINLSCGYCGGSGKRFVAVITDAGYTEVEPGTQTALAFYDPDPREEKKDGDA